MFCPPSAHLNRLQVDLEQVQNHLHQCALKNIAHICRVPAELIKSSLVLVQGKNSYWRAGRGYGL